MTNELKEKENWKDDYAHGYAEGLKEENIQAEIDYAYTKGIIAGYNSNILLNFAYTKPYDNDMCVVWYNVTWTTLLPADEILLGGLTTEIIENTTYFHHKIWHIVTGKILKTIAEVVNINDTTANFHYSNLWYIKLPKMEGGL